MVAEQLEQRLKLVICLLHLGLIALDTQTIGPRRPMRQSRREDIFRPFGHPRDGMGLRSRRVPFSRASMRLNLATNN